MKKIIIIIVISLITVSIGVYKSLFYNTHNISIRTETLHSNKLDKSLDGTKIVYFTDTHFGKLTNENDIENCVNLINKLDADIVVFGGDLIDNYSSNYITQDQKQALINNFKNIKSSQGKYYILGNHDLENSSSAEEITNILSLADFIPLINTSSKIYNGTKNYFNIIGIDSLLKGNPDFNEAYSEIDTSKYTIAFTHCPDLFKDLPLDKTDYVISGHSHGGQIYIPFVNVLYRASGCKSFFHGKHKKNTTTLDISDGVGLTSYNIRFLTRSEIVLYKLFSE